MVNSYNINKNENLYYLSKQDIEDETKWLLEKYIPDYLEVSQAIPIEKLAMKLGLDLIPQNLSIEGDVYGTFVFNTGNIITYDENFNEISNEYESKTILIDNDIYAQKRNL